MIKSDVQERLDVKVVRGEDDFEEHLLVDRNELLVPLADVRCPLAVLILTLLRLRCRERLAAVVFAVLEDLGYARQCLILSYLSQSRTPSSGHSTRHWEAELAGRSRRHLVETRSERENTVAHAIVLTFEHVLDEDAALSNLLVDDELFVVRCHEENHGASEGDWGG